MAKNRPSEIKAEAAKRNGLLACAAVRAAMEARPRWRCSQCSIEKLGTVHQMRQKYCSKACMSAGYRLRMRSNANPNYRDAAKRVCEVCDAVFASYQKGRRFCSLACRDKSGDIMRGRAKKDKNHPEIVEALKGHGASVIDTSGLAHGMPDLILGYCGKTMLMEIKNTATYYGRKGLSKTQLEWKSKWVGGPYAVVTDIESAIRALKTMEAA